MVVCEPLAIETHPGRWLFSPSVAQRTLNGRRYVDFEFTAKNRNYTRHALASVTVGNGKFYTLLTGANEKRWGRMSGKIKTVVSSFEVEDRF
jgi:photosystem II oxygen-evolving enhancer protein 2